MTYNYQFHINGLKGIKLFLQNLMLVADYESMGKTDAKEVGETIGLAIEALEKQIPKKPAKQWGDNVCPNCRTDTRCRVLMGWEKHCPNCGQAIDWSDTK